MEETMQNLSHKEEVFIAKGGNALMLEMALWEELVVCVLVERKLII